MAVDHYENFPVASALCPPALRPAVVAIYRFARCADDIADEGDAAPAQRLADLAAMRADLAATSAGGRPSTRWPQVFGPLAANLERFALPPALLGHLLDAFEQDVHNPRYHDRNELLDYCRRSANPIGRLLLHLYGIGDAVSLRQSDAACSALQLINFWQDIGLDAARGRIYLPEQDRERAGVGAHDLAQQRDSPALRALLRELCAWARALMDEGAPLALRLPGRAGWELRLVVQGGLRILDKIEAMDFATLLRRPTLGAADMPVMAWRALRMGRAA